jgi:hypothetical protein
MARGRLAGEKREAGGGKEREGPLPLVFLGGFLSLSSAIHAGIDCGMCGCAYHDDAALCVAYKVGGGFGRE